MEHIPASVVECAERTSTKHLTQMTQMTQGDLEEGNTSSKSRKVNQRARWWIIVWNNYTDTDFDTLKEWADTECEKYSLGKEVGSEKGTPHIQGFLGFKNARSWDSLVKQWPKAHIEKCKGNAAQNLTYTTKDGNFTEKGMLTNQERIKQEMLAEYDNIVWKDWQQQIIDIVKEGGNERQINWVYDQQGNNGKTFLRRWLCLTRECILADGKKDNIFNQFKVKCIDEDKRVDICILDIPRCNEKWMNYGVIESILDRHIYSGKYEGGEIWLPKMTVIVFSNFMPNMEECTEDRWNIIEL